MSQVFVMIYTSSRDKILSNLKLLSNRDDKLHHSNVRKRYLANIEELHKFKTPVNFSQDRFIFSDCISNAYADCYSDSVLNDRHQVEMIDWETPLSYEERLETFEKYSQAKEFISKVDIELHDLFEFVVHSVFTKRSKKVRGSICNAASTSNAIGVIFINSSPKLTVNDVIELLVHEFTHNLLFIDETNHVQFDYDLIIKPEYFSKSAILDKRRPLDKVVHSILVSAQIIVFRQRYGQLYDLSEVSIHPKTDVMIGTTREAITELLAGENNRKTMTDHTIELVVQAQDSLSHEPR